jgi:deoxyribose-phosphate aldolase
VSDLAAQARIALACLDLTSLNEGDDDAAIERLCAQAVGPAGRGWPAAVCVWPRFVALARARLPAAIRVAAVANFPAGDLGVDAALRDCGRIVDAGGDEVDLVLPWRALACGDAAGPAALVRAVRRACAGRTLKLIVESGELAGAALLDAACAIGLNEGADFLKTSTGKTPHGATPAAAQRMLRAIAAHPRRAQVGFKASGGIRRVADAATYIELARAILGAAALTPQRLRFGASALLADIEAVLGGRPTSAAPAHY